MQAISQTKATSEMQVMPAQEPIQDKDAFLISEALNKSQAIFDLLSSRKLEVFCISDSGDESAGFLIDANNSCKRILD